MPEPPDAKRKYKKLGIEFKDVMFVKQLLEGCSKRMKNSKTPAETSGERLEREKSRERQERGTEGTIYAGQQLSLALLYMLSLRSSSHSRGRSHSNRFLF